ncbi:hypothetical protein [Microvirga makkahensis]|uniref:Uncharacterized protein n=1 Tax=Microvirga makkahensis TaxID=1128670 RepID=A0A7X3MX98_9HYPH|nr:hypothetical protein [Microvirga makkahensis]MXQ14728.1 hypothetical protein [Microvirga makkahensis]
MNQRHQPRFPRPAAGWLAPSLIGLSLLGPAFAEAPPARPIDAPESQEAPVKAETADDLSAMLSFLITSSERKHLAADLLDSLRNGDLRRAESSINAAIETGTLAIALADRLNDPNLLASLQKLDLPSPREPSASSASVSRECSAPVAAETANLAQLQEALDHEQAYSGMVTKTLTDLMEQYNALTTRLETDASDTHLKMSELQNALRQEQQQREAIAREFANLQADYLTLQAAKEPNGASKPTDVANLESLLEHERARGDNAERQLAGMREEMRSLLAAKDNEIKDGKAAAAARIAELEEAVSQASARGDGLAQKLADATEALHSLREANAQRSIPLVSESVPLEAEAFSLLQEKDAAAPAAPVPAPAESSLPPREDRPALVEIAQPPENALPRPEAIVSAAVPAQMDLPPAVQPKAGPPPLANNPDDRLTARADELLQKGDISGARLLLERSVKNGNARAAFLLAETFDPHVLSRLGVLGLRGDVDKARQFYAQAQALGMTQASERLQALK